jgi:hypothetical protein
MTFLSVDDVCLQLRTPYTLSLTSSSIPSRYSYQGSAQPPLIIRFHERLQ